MIVIVEAYRAGLLKFKNWMPNLTAGVIVGVVALPLAMAFAIASGVKPEQGLYTAIIAGLVVGLFGGSRVQIAGPTGAFIVILANIVTQHGIVGLQIATIFAGFILLFMGLIRLGSVIKFIPDPVIVGFTSGIGVIIFVGELKDFFGLSVKFSIDAPFYLKLYKLMYALPTFDPTTTCLALLSLLLILITPRLFKRVPGPLVAMLAATGLQAVFRFKSVATLGSAFGGIPSQLPTFHIPALNPEVAFTLIGPAFTIALLGAIESLLSATAADGMAKTRHHSNQELIGQGLANIIAPLFGGFAATGAIARTATNIRNGGNSPIAAVVHSIFILLVIIFLAPYAMYVPLCSLAAILIVVAFNMSDVPHFMHISKHAPGYDLVVLYLTFFLTLFTNLVVAVNIGVILAMLFFIRRMNQFVEIEQVNHEDIVGELNGNNGKIPENTLIYTIQGPFFFGVAEKMERAFAITHSDPENLVIRLDRVPFMDITGLQTFGEIIEQFHSRGVAVYLCDAQPKVADKIMSIGINKWLCANNIFGSLDEVIQDIISKQSNNTK